MSHQFSTVNKGLGRFMHPDSGRPYPSVKKWATNKELARVQSELDTQIRKIIDDIETELDEQDKKSNN